MTEPTINLQKDLELWCEFGTDTFDSQRNAVEDKSGYNRHPEASGGPTISDDGYRGFGQASFDGTDDYFAVPSGFIDVAGDFTLSCLFRAPSGSSGTNESLVNSDNVDSNYIRLLLTGSDNILFGFGDSGAKVNTQAAGSYYDDTYHVATGVRRGNTTRIYVDGEFASEDTNSSIGNTVSNNQPYIGAKRDGSQHFSGEIAWVGFHTRALSDAEIENLNRMTGPQEARL